jgi:predicted site-specific integrase-resolvase
MSKKKTELFQKILSHHSGHLIIERVFPFLSDFELLELEKELGEREDLLEGLNAALPSIVWRLRGKRNQQGKQIISSKL